MSARGSPDDYYRGGGTPSSSPRRREKFAGPRQGDDEDWDPDAKIDISETSAIAKTHGDVAIANSRGKNIDVHELLKREVFASPGVGSDDHFEKSRPSPDAPHGFSDQYMILDSWEKDLSTSAPAGGLFGWNFNVQGSTSNQAVGVKDKLDNIVEIQIGSFMIPDITPGQQMVNPWEGNTISGFPLLTAGTDLSDTTDPLSATFGWLSPYVGRVTIEMKEIGLQSVSQRKGVRYHYEADVISVYPFQGTLSTALGQPIATPTNTFPSALRVVPLAGFDTYQFTEPIQDVHGLSLQFRVVDQLIPFPPDTILGATAYTSASLYPYLGFLLPTTSQEFQPLLQFINYGVGLGRVSISGLQTTNVPVNNWVNQAPSLLATIPTTASNGIAIAGIDPTGIIPGQQIGFVIGPLVNITPLVPTAPATGTIVEIPSATSITVRFTAARLRIPLRLRRVVQRLTNYS